MSGIQRTPRGFTLIELLVVIAIIGLLSSVVLASLNTARAKARDAQRAATIRQLQNAVEFYYHDNGSYPLGCRGSNQWSGHSTSYGDCNTNYITGIANYMPSLPIDPSGDNLPGAGFLYRSDGQGYKIMAHNSVEQGIIPKGTPLARCPASCAPSYCDDNTFAVYTSTHACY